MKLSRREFLTRGAAAGVLAAAGASNLGFRWRMTPAMQSSSGAKPNVLVILADDMGFSDIGCYGSEIRTPHLDRLARGGVRFSQAYNTARCCPSRASLLTGLYAHQAGIGRMVENLGTPAYQGYLRSDCVTIAEVLHDAGFYTWMTGKWHVGGNQAPNDPTTWHPGTPEQPTPLDRGFDKFFGTLGGAGSYYRPPLLMEQDRFIERPEEGFYYTEAIGDRACDQIRSAAALQKPFFGYIAFTAPHWPLHALPSDIERYRDRYAAGWDTVRMERYEKLKGLKLVSSDWPISPRDRRAEAWETLDGPRRNWEAVRMAVYAAMIDRLDQNVGRVITCLEETGQRENTVIIFLSDNGGCEEPLKADGSNIKRYDLPMMNGQHPRLGNIPGLAPGPEDTFMSYDVAWANVSNSPFRQFKKWVHEGGIATPLILNGPGLAQAAGSVVHDPCHIIDLFPTILEITGTKHPETYRGRRMTALAGESLLRVSAGGGHTAERALFWEHLGNRAMRLGDLKLVADSDGPWELYDLAKDRTELNDLSGQFPETVRDFEHQYLAWAKKVGAETPDELRQRRRQGGG